MQEKRGCDPSRSAAAVSNQRQRLLDTLSAFDQSCQRLKCLLCEQQKFMNHVLELEQADMVTIIHSRCSLLLWNGWSHMFTTSHFSGPDRAID